MRLLTKIFGNRDDPETAASGGPDEVSPERQTIELEPYELSAGDEPRATSEQSGRVTFAPPASDPPSPEQASPAAAGPAAAGPAAAGSTGTGRSTSEGRRKRRRTTGAEGSDEQPHELTRRRIARPTASPVDVPPTPPPIPVHLPAADDPEEIDVSDQLDEMNADVDLDAADLDASVDLIIEDEEPIGEDEDEEETSTSVSVWGAAATGPAPASSPTASSEQATSEPLAAEPAAVARPAAPAPEPESAADGSGSISPNATQPDPEWTRMPTETKRPKQTLVEAGTEFTGTVKSSCPVIVHGTLDGEIEAPSLSIATTGTVHGSIRAESLRSYGTLAGTVDAGEVYVSGVVRSQTVIRARRLELQLGHSSKSQIELTVKTTNGELSALPSSPEASSVPSSASSEPTSSARDEAPTNNDGESTGSTGWELPEAESGIEPVRARGKRTTAK